MARVFGEIEGHPEGSTFANRYELSASGVHKPTQAGISGSQHEGADSIVLSGGYEDDEDWGDLILYTGHGGRDPKTGVQVAHQTLTRQNMALAVSRKLGLPVRVIRGSRHASRFSPSEGYRYDGLYLIEDHFRERGKSGFFVWRFRMRKLSSLGKLAEEITAELGAKQPLRREFMISRVVRETALAREVKRLYDYRCQVCGTRLEGNAGPYAEAAHIRPLGIPHRGPDRLNNLLCLCPNHHVLFDYGAIAIADDFSVIGAPWQLTVHPKHQLEPEHLRYHRNRYGFDAEALTEPTPEWGGVQLSAGRAGSLRLAEREQ